MLTCVNGNHRHRRPVQVTRRPKGNQISTDSFHLFSFPTFLCDRKGSKVFPYVGSIEAIGSKIILTGEAEARCEIIELDTKVSAH
jgi:hypothetical protein